MELPDKGATNQEVIPNNRHGDPQVDSLPHYRSKGVEKPLTEVSKRLHIPEEAKSVRLEDPRTHAGILSNSVYH